MVTNDTEQPATEIPIACNLPEAAQAARGEEIAPIFDSVQQTVELADGYAFEFAGSATQAARLLEFILAERECCPFFRFELVFAPDHSAIWLHLGGGPGVKEFIAASRGMMP